MQYRDASGKPTGFTVELMELAAKEMGVTIKWEDLAWESLIPSLLTGKVDMIAANMSMTLSRMKSVRFSDPYFSTGIVVLARKNSSLVKWSDAAAPNVKMEQLWAALMLITCSKTGIKNLLCMKT
jgi:polar amino acid transport system substrate-binding protein